MRHDDQGSEPVREHVPAADVHEFVQENEPEFLLREHLHDTCRQHDPRVDEPTSCRADLVRREPKWD